MDTHKVPWPTNKKEREHTRTKLAPYSSHIKIKFMQNIHDTSIVLVSIHHCHWSHLTIFSQWRILISFLIHCLYHRLYMFCNHPSSLHDLYCPLLQLLNHQPPCIEAGQCWRMGQCWPLTVRDQPLHPTFTGQWPTPSASPWEDVYQLSSSQLVQQKWYG